MEPVAFAQQAPPAQTAPPVQTAAPAPAYTQAQLEQILAPIALYPDDLLTQVLVASTYPLEVTLASRWLEQPGNKDLKGDADAHNITVTFSGGQLADGLASVVIATKYGAYWFNPLASGGWYITTG